MKDPRDIPPPSRAWDWEAQEPQNTGCGYTMVGSVVIWAVIIAVIVGVIHYG